MIYLSPTQSGKRLGKSRKIFVFSPFSTPFAKHVGLRGLWEVAMKKLFSILLVVAITLGGVIGFVGCSESKTLLDPDNPVTLTMWHVYGEQADSPMNRLIDEFNQTVGKDNGIIVNVTLMSSATHIGQKLLDAQAGKAGTTDMPDLFFCHASNAQELGADNLIDWKDLFDEKELDTYVDDFVTNGIVDGALSVLPISKSTHCLFIAGGVFDKFALECGVSYDDLATWDGFFSVAEKYYVWSGGQPFCAIDYLLRCVELNAMSKGATDFYKDGWYDFDNEILMASFMQFADSIAKGHIIVSDLYSNTQIMTGQVIAGIGSSASVLYYNDKITYPDNTQIDVNLNVRPLPQTGGGTRNYATIAGVGLCAYKTTEQKAEAAKVFASWLNEENRNLDFVASTGYMPVLKGSFDKIDSYEFKSDAYKSLYSALATTKQTCSFLSETNMAGYWSKVYSLNANIRTLQNSLDGKTAEDIKLLFKAI